MFLVSLSNSIMLQAIQLESCSNPQKMQQVFSLDSFFNSKVLGFS